MKAEWWIDGPPERFEVGMLVQVYDSEYTGVVVWISADGDPEVVLSEDHTESLMYAKQQVTAHCPMMPVKEAEEIVRKLAESEKLDYCEECGGHGQSEYEAAYCSHCNGTGLVGFDAAGYVADERERRAGDA